MPRTIAENVAEIRGRIADAAGRSGRPASDVKLVAVTKYVSAESVRPLVAAGCCDLGESRPQQLWEKADALIDLPIRWHMIGHFQRNKVRRTLPLVSLVHSVDSERLLKAIEEDWGQGTGDGGREIGEGAGGFGLHVSMPILLEINISGESAKHGFAPEAAEALLPQLASYRNVSLRGLMCMAGLESNLDDARREFAALRQLRDRLRPNCPPGATLDDLSMGMSGDYEIAIEEGATIVRVGSALFEGLDS